MPAYKIHNKFTLPVLEAGAQLEQAAAAAVLVHGRGATAQDILTLYPLLNQPDFTCLAPQAPDNSWYPHPFTAPLKDNEPYLSASLALIGELLDYLSAAGIPAARTVLLGFSQGACLALEYAARQARRYGAVAGLSGGLIGPDGLARPASNMLEGTPVFLGCSEEDPFIPKRRVEQSASWLRQLGGSVTVRLYPGLGHAINEDEIDFIQSLMAGLSAP